MKTLHDDRLDEKQLSTRTAFEGRLLHLYVDQVKLPNGNDSTREYILHQGAVGILPVMEDGSMVFVKQFRYPVHSVIYEIPAGKLEKGEEILPSAQRELSEETGLTADHWTRMTSIVTTPDSPTKPSICSWPPVSTRERCIPMPMNSSRWK